MPNPRPGGLPAATLVLLLLAAGCTPLGSSAGHTGQAPHQQSSSSAAAAEYLAAVEPANRRLDAEVQSYSHHEHRNLAAAEAALRAEAVTERWFDQRLVKIPFPPPAAATAQALVRANERRAELAVRQAGSPSLAALQSFTRRHQSADAAVEAQVKAIRRTLGLPPPTTS
ncbi:MAG TPA: hypothetical protein VH136_15360 [Trebonia sp.]|nr:hypothetical protein [Trebonia sp.]